MLIPHQPLAVTARKDSESMTMRCSLVDLCLYFAAIKNMMRYGDTPKMTSTVRDGMLNGTSRQQTAHKTTTDDTTDNRQQTKDKTKTADTGLGLKSFVRRGSEYCPQV